MSGQAQIIREGQIGKKKLARQQSVIAGRVALMSLIDAATYAQDKNIEHIDIAALKVHLETLTNHQELIIAIDEEIKRLEY